MSAQPDDPHNSSHWQLFLDDHIIERSTGFQRVLHHPEARGPVLVPERPWEAQGITPLYVGRRADGRLECYYRAHWWNGKGEWDLGQASATAYAVSEDGTHWEKPELNLVEGPSELDLDQAPPTPISKGSGTANNLVPCGHLMPVGELGNATDPAQRFAVCIERPGKWGRLGISFCSQPPDLLGDPDWKAKCIDSGGYHPGPNHTLDFWDDLHQEWVCMRQGPNHPPTRVVARWGAKDLKDWTMKSVLYPDAADSTDPRYADEVYGMRAIYTEGMALGYISWLIADQTRPDLSLYDHGFIGRTWMKGTMDTRIVVSRDGGFTWDRTVSREAWIPHGTEQDSYDRMVIPHCPPLQMGDEDWFYITVVNGDHGSAGGYYRDRIPNHQGALYVQKHNRYVSFRAGNTPQVLITKPLEVTGDTLQLNVDASYGRVEVGIGIDKYFEQESWPFRAILPNFMPMARDKKSHLEPGFDLADCEPALVNTVEHTVRFKDADLASLKGKTVRLYIRVTDADVYGFRFQSQSAATGSCR